MRRFLHSILVPMKHDRPIEFVKSLAGQSLICDRIIAFFLFQ